MRRASSAFNGALIMQVITTGFVMNGIRYVWSLVIKAAIIVVAFYIQRPKAACSSLRRESV